MIGRFARAARASVLRSAWACGLYEPPDRQLLDRILEHYADAHGFERVLFVACKKYNAKHRALFVDRSYATIDPNPAVARFGGSRHVVGRIEDAEAHFGARCFTVLADVRAAASARRHPGGRLISLASR